MSGGRTSDQRINDEKLPAWQADLIDQIANAMKNFYCLPKKFAEHEVDFRRSLAKAFIAINDSHSPIKDSRPSTQEEYQIYVDMINRALGEFDPHLEIKYDSNFIDYMEKNNKIEKNRENRTAKFDFGSGPPKEELLAMNSYRGKPEINYGFITKPTEDITIPADIGYLKINFLLHPKVGAAAENEKEYRVGPNAIDALYKAMKGMEGKKGIIIDLRDAPEGGFPEMVERIISFFIKQKGITINEVDDRLTGTRTFYKTVDTPSQLFDAHVDILTDGTTFSAREEIAYDFQQLNIQLQKDGEQIGDRFQVIGEVTRGGAHPEFAFPLMDSSGGVNDDIILRIPCARSINPTSGTNWEDQEKKGVQPDIAVDKKLALVTAVDHLQNVIAQAEHTERATASPATIYSALAKPTHVPPSQLARDHRTTIEQEAKVSQAVELNPGSTKTGQASSSSALETAKSKAKEDQNKDSIQDAHRIKK